MVIAAVAVATAIATVTLGLGPVPATAGRQWPAPAPTDVRLAAWVTPAGITGLRHPAVATACHSPWIRSVPGSPDAFARADVEVPFEGEQRSGTGPPAPLLAVVGASFTAGVGAGAPFLGWPYLLGRLLGYQVAAVGVPGAGYVRRGVDGGGPVRRELQDLHLHRLSPRVVVVQAGHNDIGEPAARVARRVRQDLALVRASAPGATVVLLGVFPKGRPSAAARETSAVIARAAHHADPSAVVVQPIADHWHFPTIAGGLHPDPAGHRWIARAMAAVLRHAGVAPTAAGDLAGSLAGGGGAGATIEDRICPLPGFSLSRVRSGPNRRAVRVETTAAASSGGPAGR